MKRKSWMIGLVLAVALLAGCFGGGSPKGQLTGKIYDESTQELITQSVTVTLDGKAGLVEGGQYSFSELSPGTKYLTVEAEGYLSAADIAVTITSGTVTHDVYLQPETPPLQLGGVKGAITNAETGQPVLTDVTVKLDGMPGDVDEGEYSFENVTAGNKELVVEAAGYVQYNSEIEIIADQIITHDVHLEPIAPVFEIDEVLVPSATSFPTGTDDSGTCTSVHNEFYLAKYQTTYGLWTEVKNWAKENGYRFQNEGQMGGYYSQNVGQQNDNHPVTIVSWRDAVVWCNALTEYYNFKNELWPDLGCVYTHGEEVLRDSRDSNALAVDNAIAENASGFRLPFTMEWELAARYIDGSSWNSGSHVSGDESAPVYSDDPSVTISTVFGNYIWYGENSEGTTREVGLKEPNALGIHDMNGNVWEWCFNDEPSILGQWIGRGGAWITYSLDHLQIGHLETQEDNYRKPTDAYRVLGFRIARTK